MHIVEERACGNSRSTYTYFGPFEDEASASAFRERMEADHRRLMLSCCDRVTMQYRDYPVKPPESVMPNGERHGNQR